MIRQMLAVVLAWTLGPPVVGAAPPQEGRKPSIKEQVLSISAGTVVEVRTRDKQRIGGRMGETSDQGFKVQRLQNEKMETVTVDFQNVKSVKAVADSHGSSGKTIAYVIVGVLAALGILAVIGLATQQR